ncbi:MAG: hypothetical protein ABIP89_06985, partial [Polyangiaceae bacterium]
MMTAFAVVALAAATGCTADVHPPKETTATTDQAIYIAPRMDCRNATIHIAHAIPHTPESKEAGYWRSFPNYDVVDPTVKSYEQNLWNISHTDGYEYLVENDFWTTNQKVYPAIETTRLVYLVGIADQNTNYLMQPPAVPRTPWNQP